MGCCGGSEQPQDPAEKDDEQKTQEIQSIDVVATYKFGRTLGSGASCRVVEASDKQDVQVQAAIKIMDKERSISKKLYQREVAILERLTPNKDKPHKGILPFMGHGEDDDSYYIVTRLLWGGELFDRIVSKDDEYKITEKIAVKLVCDMLQAVKYCHDNDIVHRDLKPENFVFASKRVESDIVLIDYGCARRVKDNEVIDDVVGTAYYLAPELAAAALENYAKKGVKVSGKVGASKPRTGKILKAADVWSMGVIAYVMMTGRAPFRGRNNIGIFESTCTKPLVFPEKDARYHNKLSLNAHFKDFVKKALEKDPEKRISIEDAIRHPWVQGVDAKDYRLNRDVIHYLRQFKYQSRLKAEITRVLAANMTDEPSKQVLRHFKRLDADNDGFLDLEELTFLLLDMGYVGHTAKEEAQKMIENADKNGDGVIDFDEFKQVWYRKVLTTNDQYIHRVFAVFDDNGDGFIDAKELHGVLGDDFEQILKMIEEVDENGDGKLSFDEFQKAMQEHSNAQKFEDYGGLGNEKVQESDRPDVDIADVEEQKEEDDQ
mmetsp:Transcript_30898/g.49577  ORF Transcript_30898/g.49577 Transcript_30898/m.49577 type:complete len:546 (-) Transcript_30898:313-1950(-)